VLTISVLTSELALLLGSEQIPGNKMYTT